MTNRMRKLSFKGDTMLNCQREKSKRDLALEDDSGLHVKSFFPLKHAIQLLYVTNKQQFRKPTHKFTTNSFGPCGRTGIFPAYYAFIHLTFCLKLQTRHCHQPVNDLRDMLKLAWLSSPIFCRCLRAELQLPWRKKGQNISSRQLLQN